jgi:hypothetical protein
VAELGVEEVFLKASINYGRLIAAVSWSRGRSNATSILNRGNVKYVQIDPAPSELRSRLLKTS